MNPTGLHTSHIDARDWVRAVDGERLANDLFDAGV